MVGARGTNAGERIDAVTFEAKMPLPVMVNLVSA